MSHPRLSRRGVLIGGVAALAAVGGGSSWALDRFVIDHPQVSNVSDLEAQASSTATSAPSVAAGEPTIAVTTWTQGSGTDKVTGYVADVTTPDASFLRTAFAEDTFGTNIVADPSVIAAQVGATLAINGDYYGFRDEGIVIRNGIAYRDAGAEVVYAPGLRDLASLVLDKQVRVGRPIRVRGLAEVTSGPTYATCAGLLTYAVAANLSQPRAPREKSTPATGGRFGRLGAWLKEHF